MESNKHLTYEQWCEKFQVSKRYIEPMELYQNNPSSGIEPIVELYETGIERFIRVLFLHLKSFFRIGY